MMTTDRCDSCGRFMSEPYVVEPHMWWGGDGMNYEEAHYCERCVQKEAIPREAPSA